MNFAAIYTEALTAAQMAADAFGPEDTKSLNCGYAWVHIEDGRSPFVRWCKAQSKGDKHWKRGWCIYASDIHNRGVQQVGIHYAAAKAFADVLRTHGIDCYATSRLD